MRSCARRTKAVLPKYLAVRMGEAHFCYRKKYVILFKRGWGQKDLLTLAFSKRKERKDGDGFYASSHPYGVQPFGRLQ